MAKDFSKAFYNSKEWRHCKEEYLKSKFYLCERCGNPATIVHHRTYLTPSNIENPEMRTSWSNLEALCQDCHNKEHHSKYEKPRWICDEYGRVTAR